MRIFFGGPLTNLKNPSKAKEFYIHMAAIAKKNGVESFWAFLNGTDPVKNPEVPSNTVYTTDLEELEKSDVMIAYVGEPTTGTGQEIQYAKDHGIPVYLLYEKDRHVSRMIFGSPNIKGSIAYSSQEDALRQLDELIQGLKVRLQSRGTLREQVS